MEQLGLGKSSSSTTLAMMVRRWANPLSAFRWKTGWNTERELNEQVVSVFITDLLRIWYEECSPSGVVTDSNSAYHYECCEYFHYHNRNFSRIPQML